MAELDSLIENKIEVEDRDVQTFEQKLPISFFQEIENDVCDKLWHVSSGKETDQTDGPLDFIQNIVDNVCGEFEGFLEDGDKKTFLRILTKLLAILLTIKADNSKKIINIVKYAISTVMRTLSGEN